MPRTPGGVYYELRIVDRLGNLQRVLDDAVLTEATWELNGPGQILYTLPQNSDNIGVPDECSNEVQLWVEGSLMHWAYHFDSDESPASVSFTNPGLLGYMGHRFVTNTSYYYGFGSDGVTVLAHGVEQLDIAADLWQQKNYDINIPVGSYSASGKKRYRDYNIFQHQNMLEILQEFNDLADADGNATGFDFDIDISTPPFRYFKLYYPQKGTTHTELGLEWGRNVVDYTVKKSGDGLCTDVYYTGGSNGDIKFEQYAHFDDFLTRYGHWEDIRAITTEDDVDTLKERAQHWVRHHQHPSRFPDITAIEVPDKLLGVVLTGDTVPVRINNGRTHVNDSFRILKITWVPGPGNLKYVFQDPDDFLGED